MSSSFTVKLCSEKVGYEVHLKRRVMIDLPSIAEQVASATGLRVRVALPVILILESDTSLSVTMFQDGRMLLRGIESQDEAEALASKIAAVIPEM